MFTAPIFAGPQRAAGARLLQWLPAFFDPERTFMTRAKGIPRGTGTARRLAVFNYGFRPFFLAAGLWPVVAMAFWVAALHGHPPPSAFGPVAWHAHEMLYGFVVAAAAGFLLTAIPNWTGRLPVSGWPLALLAALWLAGRLAVVASAVWGVGLAAVVDCGFLAALLLFAVREVARGRNWRNLPIVGALTALLTGNVLSHLAVLGLLDDPLLGVRVGVATMAMLISLIGGRVVPSFTRNWLKKRGESRFPAPTGHLDQVALGVSLASLLVWLARPFDAVTATLLLLAAIAQAVRLGRWRGHRTGAEPLVWVLHAGYAWLPLGLALLAASALLPAWPQSTALHALTAGAMGTMILAMATRATLGHTARELTAGPATTAAYLLVIAGALLRLATPLVPAVYMQMVGAVAALWAGGFLVFSLVYGPMLLGPRIDGRPG